MHVLVDAPSSEDQHLLCKNPLKEPLNEKHIQIEFQPFLEWHISFYYLKSMDTRVQTPLQSLAAISGKTFKAALLSKM